MRADAPGQSALLMLDVADVLAARSVRYAVIGAMAAAVHGVIRASLDADAVVGLPVAEARSLRQALADAGYAAELRIGDVNDPIPALLEVHDAHGNRVDLLIGLRGMDPAALSRARPVGLHGAALQVIGREDFIAMKAYAGGPLDLADARAVLAQDAAALDLPLLRSLAARFGREAERNLESLLADPG